MFQAIIEDRNAPKVEKAIDGYSGFLFYDDNGRGCRISKYFCWAAALLSGEYEKISVNKILL